MKIQYRCLLLFGLIGLQACSSVEGPVHFYSGQARSNSETARLNVPAPLTVVKIDGREVEVPSKNEGFYEIYLLPGVHRIDFKYELSWGDEVSGMLVKSDVVGVESQFFAGKLYELTYSVPTDLDEAYDMTRDFRAQLLEKYTGRQVASRTMIELNEFSSKSSDVAIRDNSTQPKDISLPTVETFGATATNNINAPAPNSKAKTVIVPKDIKADTVVREDAVKRLKFWWLIANETERNSFKKWIKLVEDTEIR